MHLASASSPLPAASPAVAVRQDLLARDEEFRQLAQRHSDLDAQIQSLQARPFLSADEEAEEIRLKKLKLQIKDEMERRVRLGGAA